MTRNACLNHPKDKVIEIPAGFKYCERCHHLVPPELEIVEIVQEMELEAETEQSVEEMKEEVEKIIEDSNIPEEVKKDIVIEIVKEEPLEAESGVVVEIPEETPVEAVKKDMERRALEEAKKAEIEALKEEAAEVITIGIVTDEKRAKIAALRAKLEALEKTEE